MTENRNQASQNGRRQKNIYFLIPAICLLLSACTFFRPPGRDLPDRSSIQTGEEITVERGQNVYSIAHKNGVSMREVIVLNDLKPPFVIRPGQKLLLPAKGQDYAPTPSAAPVSGIVHQPLDSFEPADSAAPTPFTNESITATPLEAPQTLPSLQQPAALTPPAAAKPVETTVGNELQLAPPTKLAEAHTEALPKPETMVSRPDVPFAWPVQGPIVSAFGPKAQGTNNDGVNIAAPKGAPVLSAAGGIVVYAGNEMKGFGNLVLIRHEGGWVTAYAHLDRMLVARDTVVAPGDMIGTVGSTGGVASPQLHFETRHEGKAVDPQTLIKKS
ncbi:MAG: M23 family metallopeptidase [Alphaproteobacteria bacterium]|nr:M23 family metallopeptidase [Alphaproteobacteria bacterium]